MSTTEYRLKLETEAAMRLRERIMEEYSDDTDLIRDSIEGSTDLHEMLGVASFELSLVEGEKDGIEAAVGKMKDRLARHCTRAEKLRGLIADAMTAAELPSIKTPAATLSMRAAPPRVEITDATALPAVYLNQPPAVPDKRAIGAALKAGEAVPGAVMSNQPPALSVRFT